MAKKKWFSPIVFLTLVSLASLLIMWDFFVELVGYLDPFNDGHTFIWVHLAVFLTLFILECAIRRRSIVRPLIISGAGISLHALVYWISFKVSGATTFTFRPAPLVMVTVTYVFYLFVFSVVYHVITELARYKAATYRLRRNGEPATAMVEEAWDMGDRLEETNHNIYLVKLKLKITGQQAAPYSVTDLFWISEFHIHRIAQEGEILPVRVDMKNLQKVAIDLPWSQDDDAEDQVEKGGPRRLK